MTIALSMQTDDITKSLQEIEQTQRMSRELMKTPHYAKMGEVGIFTIVQKARSIGLNPLDALNGAMYFVNGKVELSANTMNYLIRTLGHSITKDDKSNREICILRGRRADNGDTWTASFSIQEAKAAGIYKNTWEKYPEDMLFARALTRLARQLFPDVIKGCYVENEIRDSINSPPSHHEEIKVMDVKPLYISLEQAQEIKDILKNCDEEYQQTFLSTLKKLFHANCIEEIPENAYDRILKGAMNRVQENAKKRQEEAQSSAHIEEAGVIAI
jgi:hypothetical protein